MLLAAGLAPGAARLGARRLELPARGRHPGSRLPTGRTQMTAPLANRPSRLALPRRGGYHKNGPGDHQSTRRSGDPASGPSPAPSDTMERTAT